MSRRQARPESIVGPFPAGTDQVVGGPQEVETGRETVASDRVVGDALLVGITGIEPFGSCGAEVQKAVHLSNKASKQLQNEPEAPRAEVGEGGTAGERAKGRQGQNVVGQNLAAPREQAAGIETARHGGDRLDRSPVPFRRAEVAEVAFEDVRTPSMPAAGLGWEGSGTRLPSARRVSRTPRQ